VPASYREIVGELRTLGLVVQEGGSKRGKGSHAEVRTADGKFITVLTHHNSHDQLQNSAIKGLSRRLAEHVPGFDEAAWVAKVTGRPIKSAASAAE
jgi:predicted RNA binding protein YcfA (HicA-like mRNA interferase family)